jgi:hypothetical protein
MCKKLVPTWQHKCSQNAFIFGGLQMFLENLFTISQSFTNHCWVIDCEELDDDFKMEFFSLKTPSCGWLFKNLEIGRVLGAIENNDNLFTIG